MILWLRHDISTHWTESNAFESAAEQKGDIYRAKEGRRTLRFTLAGNSYFLKHHSGIGWKEVIKNLLQARLPVTSAMNEVNAIQRLTAAGISTMTLAAYGKRHLNPAATESFIVTDDLVNTISLEDLTENWQVAPPCFSFKQALIAEVANTARRMHSAGVNHRDFYLCHFLMDREAARHEKLASLHLIDLHRAQCRKAVPKRWIVKDIAGLYFSAMDAGLTQRDLLRAMSFYTGKSWRATLSDDRTFWQAVQQRAERLYEKDHNKTAPTWF